MDETFFTAEGDAPAKKRILVEALSLFTRKGLLETTIRDIAAASGYTNPALYKHFASKDELALYLFGACYRELVIRIEGELRRARSLDERLRAFVTGFLEFYDESPEAVVFVHDHLSRFWPQVPEHVRRTTIPGLVRKLARERSEGAEPSEDALVVLVTGTLAQLARMLYLRGVEGPARRWVDEMTELFVRAFR